MTRKQMEKIVRAVVATVREAAQTTEGNVIAVEVSDDQAWAIENNAMLFAGMLPGGWAVVRSGQNQFKFRIQR